MWHVSRMVLEDLPCSYILCEGPARKKNRSYLHGYTVHQRYQSFTVQLMHIYSLLKTIKIWEVLLQHFSVYTETIIREPVSTLLKLHMWFIWLHSWPCGRRQYLAA